MEPWVLLAALCLAEGGESPGELRETRPWASEGEPAAWQGDLAPGLAALPGSLPLASSPAPNGYSAGSSTPHGLISLSLEHPSPLSSLPRLG